MTGCYTFEAVRQGGANLNPNPNPNQVRQNPNPGPNPGPNPNPNQVKQGGATGWMTQGGAARLKGWIPVRHVSVD